MIVSNVIQPEELDEWISEGKAFQLIDISEENILKSLKINADWIPGIKILEKTSLIKNEIPIVLCCQNGCESFLIVNILIVQYHFKNILSLKSGINGWKTLVR